MTKQNKTEESKGRNFILDPDFRNWGKGEWETGKPKKYNKKKEGNKTYLFISGEGCIFQTINLPKKSSGELSVSPFYSLSFDYFVTYNASVSVTLIFLNNGNERDRNEIALPDEESWHHYAEPLNILPEDTDIRVEFFAGEKKGNLGLNLTAVDMQLHLGAFEPESISLDNSAIQADKPLLPLSYGHKHTLNIKPADNSAWGDLDCGFKWNSDTPASNYPVSFIPELGILQPLNDGDSGWNISCLPQKVSGIPETFSVMLVTEYSSVPFVFEAALGNYLYKLADPEISGIAVIAQNVSSEISIRVICDYDEQYPEITGVHDVDVQWKTDDGEIIGTTKTDIDGKTVFKFLPGKSGTYKLTALITDKKGRESNHQFEIIVYERSPWLDDTRIEINSNAVDLSGEAIYLMNGVGADFHLNCDKNRSVFGRVKLENKKGNTGISLTPVEGRKIPPEGLSWEVNRTGSDSKEQTLLLTCDQFDISQEIRVITLQSDTGKEIQSLKINNEEKDEKTPLIIAPQESVTLNCTVNKLLSRLQAELNSKDSQLLTAEPAFGQLQTLKNNSAEWVIHNASPQGGFFNLDLNIPPLTIPLTLSGRILPQEIASGIDVITLNNMPVTTPVNLLLAPGKTCTLTVKPHPLLKDIPVSLVAETSNGISVISDPPFGQEVSLAENGTSWQISADPASARGKFSLQIQSQWGGVPVNLDGVVLSADLQDEGSVCVTDGDMGRKYDIDFNIGFAFQAFEIYSLDLKLLPDNLISGQTVSWELTEGDHHRDAVSFDPDTPMVLDLPGTDWEFSYTEGESTQFDLVLNSQGKFSYQIPCHIFSDEKYLENSQCIFMLNDSVIVPGIKHNDLEYKKEISLKLKLSQEISAFLNGMELALVVHKVDDEGDSLIITSDELITVDKNKPDLEWTVETDVEVGHRFTLEIVLNNLKDIRAVMEFTSVSLSYSN